MSDFEFATDDLDFGWDDDDIFKGGADRVKKKSEPPDDYQPKESEAFSSMMHQKRQENRKRLEKSIKKESKSVNEEEEKAKALAEIFKIEDVTIRRDLINQVYKDFRAFQKQNVLKERIKEIESLRMTYQKQKDEEPICKVSTGPRHASKLVQPSKKFSVQQPCGRTSSKQQDCDMEMDWDNDLDLSEIIEKELFSPKKRSPSPLKKRTPSPARQKTPLSLIKAKKKDYYSLGLDISLSSEDERPTVPEFKEKDKIKKYEDLIQDKYYPGIIDDAVNRKVNFYQLGFDISFGSEGPPPTEPVDGPPSLIEAFDMRVGLEVQQRHEQILSTDVSYDGDLSLTKDEIKDKSTDNSFLTYIRNNKNVNRDEILVANAVEIDLLNVVRNRPDNELIKAINALFKAEVMNDFDKSTQAAEVAFSSAPPDIAENYAIEKSKTFKLGETRDGRKFYRPIEIVSYMGVTKPFKPPTTTTTTTTTNFTEPEKN